jgi:hypothetical protein
MNGGFPLALRMSLTCVGVDFVVASTRRLSSASNCSLNASLYDI